VRNAFQQLCRGKIIIRIVAMLLLFLVFQLSFSGCSSERQVRPRGIHSKNGWSPNIKVMASVGMDYLSYFYSYSPSKDGTKTETQKGYTFVLLDKVSEPGISGLEEAHNALEKQGFESYMHSRVFPPSTPVQLGGWQKGDSGKHRYVLIIDQVVPGKNEETWMLVSFAGSFKKAVMKQELYGIPEENILQYDGATKEQVVQGVAWLKKQMMYDMNAEAIIYYAGHGGKGWIIMPWKGEGEEDGMLWGPEMEEHEFKELINRELGSIYTNASGKPYPPVLIILDTCQSGAFIL
jgi:hypothetical protein